MTEQTHTESNEDIVVVEFSKPYHFEGKVYEKLEIDFGELKGRDLERVKKEWTAGGNFAAVTSVDQTYCALIACRAAGLDQAFAENLPAKDYIALTSAAQAFLLG